MELGDGVPGTRDWVPGTGYWVLDVGSQGGEVFRQISYIPGGAPVANYHDFVRAYLLRDYWLGKCWIGKNG